MELLGGGKIVYEERGMVSFKCKGISVIDFVIVKVIPSNCPISVKSVPYKTKVLSV